jgi:ADP-dependent NAD(P)H-hydrate dehydratase / NAD(P)H-hydrate epimerase
MMRILSVSEMRALESTADMAGHSYDQMMELAGQGVARAILERTPVKHRRILVLVGPGNNGGDGLVAARCLSDAGANVTAYLSRPRDPEEDAVFRKAQNHGVAIQTARADAGHEALRQLVYQSHILIDALLGTGATPPLRGVIAKMIQAVHESLAQTRNAPLIPVNTTLPPKAPRPFIVAVDGPSGMDFDTGEHDPATLTAHLTVTFATPKWGHVRLPGAAAVGDLIVADIGIPQGIDIPGEGPTLLTPNQVQQWLPPRPLDAHKGTFGKLLIVAGSTNYTGAAALSAISAIRAGAGLVTLAIPSSLHAAIAPFVPEATYLLLPHTLGVVNINAAPLVREKMDGRSALLIGPGLNNTPESKAFLKAFFQPPQEKRGAGFLVNHNQSAPSNAEPVEMPPLVIDADGLNLLSELPDWPTLCPPDTILTPHPGEMARLTDLSTSEIQADRVKIAQQYASEWKHVVVLKGAFTIIAAPNGRAALLPFANPALSSAGTGDVLVGAIAALRAQGLDAFEAAAAGAYLHGLAGEIARDRQSMAGVAARDVAAALPQAWRNITR